MPWDTPLPFTINHSQCVLFGQHPLQKTLRQHLKTMSSRCRSFLNIDIVPVESKIPWAEITNKFTHSGQTWSWSHTDTEASLWTMWRLHSEYQNKTITQKTPDSTSCNPSFIFTADGAGGADKKKKVQSEADLWSLSGFALLFYIEIENWCGWIKMAEAIMISPAGFWGAAALKLTGARKAAAILPISDTDKLVLANPKWHQLNQLNFKP